MSAGVFNQRFLKGGVSGVVSGGCEESFGNGVLSPPTSYINHAV